MNWVARALFDAASAWLVGKTSAGLRTLQTGYVRSYALMFLLGVVAILAYIALA